MKTIALCAGLAVGSVLAVAPTWAKPLDTRQVGADAAWVVHLDVEAAMRSRLVSEVMKHPELYGTDMEGLGEAREELGLDPTRDLTGITIWGATDDATGAVVVVTATSAVDGAIEKLRQKETKLAATTEDGRTLYTWTEDGEEAGGGESFWATVRPGPLPAERIVVVAGTKAQLLGGLDVLDGKAQNIQPRERELLTRSAKPGSIVYAAATRLPRQAVDGMSRVVKNAQSGALDIGEVGDDLYLDAAVTTKAAEDATNVAQMLQGLVAMGRMMAQGDPEAAPLADLLSNVQVGSQGAEASVHALVRTQKLLDLMSANAAHDANDDGAAADDGHADAKAKNKVEVRIGGGSGGDGGPKRDPKGPGVSIRLGAGAAGDR